MPTALIVLDQGGPAPAGEALEGTLVGGAVTVTNDDNTGVASWTITLLDAPPNSATYPAPPVVLGSAATPTPSAIFTPDVAGSYRIELEVVDGGAQSDRDIRNFGVRNGRNIIIPPYQQIPPPLPVTGIGAKPDEMNFGGQSRGWAGDGASGLLQQFMESYDDQPVVTVATTPYNLDPLDSPLHFVDTGTIGSDAVVNLPSTGMRAGQRFRVVNGWGTGFIVTINRTGGLTINGSLTAWVLLPGMAAELVFDGTSTFYVVDASKDRYERSVVASTESTNTTGFTAIGATYLDTADFPNLEATTWQAILETTDGGDAAEIRLFNVTDAAVVAGSVLSTTSLTPALVSASITLASGAKLYEAQLRLQTTGSPNQATCKQAQVILDWFQ